MSSSPLDGLIQQVYDETRGQSTRYLLLSSCTKQGEWEVVLIANTDGGIKAWAGLGDDTRAVELADAISTGMLHVEPRPSGGLKLVVGVSKTTVSIYADAEPATDQKRLMDGTFALLSQTTKHDDSEARVLASKLEERDAETASLEARLNNMRASAARQPCGSQPGGSQGSPRRKAPGANVRVLQPNQKRRKVTEEEFAGSDDSDTSDD